MSFTKQKFIEDQKIIMELSGRLQELQNEVNCIYDSKDFRDAESICSGNSHVTSPPGLFPRNPPFDVDNCASYSPHATHTLLPPFSQCISLRCSVRSNLCTSLLPVTYHVCLRGSSRTENACGAYRHFHNSVLTW